MLTDEVNPKEKGVFKPDCIQIVTVKTDMFRLEFYLSY